MLELGNLELDKPWQMFLLVTPNALILDFTLNFGGALPMGSKNVYKF